MAQWAARAEEAYVVNTEEDEEAPIDDDPGSYDEDEAATLADGEVAANDSRQHR